MNFSKKWDSCAIQQYTCVPHIQDHLKEEDLQYFSEHPEIRAIIRTILHEAINKPPSSPAQLAALVFDCNVNEVLKLKIDEERKFVLSFMKKSDWSKNDFETYICKSESTHSLLSNTSISTDMESILRFCFILPKTN